MPQCGMIFKQIESQNHPLNDMDLWKIREKKKQKKPEQRLIRKMNIKKRMKNERKTSNVWKFEKRNPSHKKCVYENVF